MQKFCVFMIFLFSAPSSKKIKRVRAGALENFKKFTLIQHIFVKTAGEDGSESF